MLLHFPKYRRLPATFFPIEILPFICCEAEWENEIKTGGIARFVEPSSSPIQLL